MKFTQELFPGQDGKQYLLRSPVEADAEQMIQYLKATAQETEYGLSYPEELDFTVQKEADFLRRFLDGPGSIMISVFDGDQLVGNASLTNVLSKQKTLHRAEFGIAILKQAWRQGLGCKLVSELIAFAKQAGYEQIELEVAAENAPAIHIYQKLGFAVYGERPRSLKLKNGSYLDEWLMILNLN